MFDEGHDGILTNEVLSSVGVLLLYYDKESFTSGNNDSIAISVIGLLRIV